MTWQRRNQQRRRTGDIMLYSRKLEKDSRGNEQWTDDALIGSIPGAIMTLRSYKADIDGQEHIEQYRFIVSPHPKLSEEKAGLYTYLIWRGIRYDIHTPPVYTPGGSRHVEHWMFDVRRH